jgi:hypothetical protein
VPSIESILIAVGVVLVVSGLKWAHYRWIRPWVMRRWIDKTLAKIQAGDYVPPPKPSDFAVSIDAAGVTVISKRPASEPACSVAWSKIVRVVAFKRDMFTVDCICLQFATADGTATEVNEEMAGWEALTAAIPEHLPGSKVWNECFSKVAFPAFATNETVIFERASSTKMSRCGSE